MSPIAHMLFFAAALSWVGCGSDSDDADQGEVTIHLDHAIAGAELIPETIAYRNAAGNEYGISRLEYIVSDVYLERDDGTRTLVAAQHYRNAFDSATRSFSSNSGLVRNSHTASSFLSWIPSRSAAPAVCAIQ